MTEETKIEIKERFVRFVNLAKVIPCDKYIRDELASANIPALEFPNEDTTKHVVPWHVVGVLGRDKLLAELKKTSDLFKILDSYSLDVSEAGFIFKRGWVYWTVAGYVPLDVAKIIYKGSCNLGGTIRAIGHNGNPNPEDIASDGLVCGTRFIQYYHIDCQEGLNFFVKVLREHKLI